MKIEVAHIYSNEAWGVEQEHSLKIFSKINPSTKPQILIDNYHVSSKSSNLDMIKSLLHKKGFEADLYLEEDLINLGNYFNLTTKKTRKGTFFKNFKIKKENEEYTCVYLTALWYLKQTGFFNNQKEFFLVLLPKKYISNEKKALDLVKVLAPDYYSLIGHIFF